MFLLEELMCAIFVFVDDFIKIYALFTQYLTSSSKVSKSLG